MKCGYLDPSNVIVTDHGLLTGRSDAGQHPASAITFTPDGSISATTVQAAIVEVRDEAATAADSVRITITSLGHGLVAGDCVYFIP
jgi:hypothetical protein